VNGSGCEAQGPSCADEHYSKYSDAIFSGEHGEALVQLRNAYHCDTANEDVALEFGTMLMEYGRYDEVIPVWKKMAEGHSLFPYIAWQLASDHVSGSEDISIVKAGLETVDDRENNFSNIVFRTLAIHMVHGRELAIQFLDKHGDFEAPHDQEIVEHLRIELAADNFKVEKWLFNDRLEDQG